VIDSRPGQKNVLVQEMVFSDAKISTEKRQYGEFIWKEKYEIPFHLRLPREKKVSTNFCLKSQFEKYR
jgi:hypothetical protein